MDSKDERIQRLVEEGKIEEAADVALSPEMGPGERFFFGLFSIWLIGIPIAWYPIWVWMDWKPKNMAELVEMAIFNTIFTVAWPIPAMLKLRAWLATFPL